MFKSYCIILILSYICFSYTTGMSLYDNLEDNQTYDNYTDSFTYTTKSEGSMESYICMLLFSALMLV